MKVRETGELPEPASGKKEYATLLQSICIALYADSCRYKIPRNQQQQKHKYKNKDKDNNDDWDDRHINKYNRDRKEIDRYMR